MYFSILLSIYYDSLIDLILVHYSIALEIKESLIDSIFVVVVVWTWQWNRIKEEPLETIKKM